VVQRSLVGWHFNDLKEITFKSISVSFSNATEWLNASGIQYAMPLSGKMEDVSLKYSSKEVAEVNVDQEWSLRISTRASIQPPAHSLELTEASIREQMFFQIHPFQEKPIEWFFEKIGLLSNFLTLGIGSPSFPLIIRGSTEQAFFVVGGEKKLSEIGIFYPLIGNPKAFKNRSWFEMFFAYGHIASDFETMIKRWFEKAELLNPVYDLYFGTLFNSSMYLQHEFLSLLQASESYHRRTHGGRFLVDGEYESIRRSLTEIIPSDLDVDFKDSLKNRIKYGNEYSLRKRLRELLKQHEVFVRVLIENPDEFISQVVDTRNYLTHYTDELEEKSQEGNALYVLSQKIKFLIEICLLSELGLSEQSIQQRIDEDSRYSHIKDNQSSV
jgi:hypothetical protein